MAPTTTHAWCEWYLPRTAAPPFSCTTTPSDINNRHDRLGAEEFSYDSVKLTPLYGGDGIWYANNSGLFVCIESIIFVDATIVMPAIYIFQKRTLFGGDDLQLPALLTILARLVQGTALIIPQIYYLIQEANEKKAHSSDLRYLVDFLWKDPVANDDNQDADEACHHSHFFPLWTSSHLILSSVFLLASMTLEYQLYWWSGQGTPTWYRQPRTAKVENLLEIKLFWMTLWLMAVFLAWTVSITYWNTFRDCRNVLQADDNDAVQVGEDDDESMVIWMGSNSWWAFSVMLALSQLVEILLAAIFYLRLSQVDQLHQALVEEPYQPQQHEFTEELWADRCNWMCQCLSISTCFLFGGQDLTSQNNHGVPYYEHLSKAMADYLETRGTLDVVPTDLVTGLLVLQRVQRQRILEARLQVVRCSQSQLQLFGLASANSASQTRRNLDAEGAYGMIGSSTDLLSPSYSSSLRVRTNSQQNMSNATELTHQIESPVMDKNPGLKRRTSGSPSFSQDAYGPPSPPPSGQLPETTRLVTTTTLLQNSMQEIYRRLVPSSSTIGSPSSTNIPPPVSPTSPPVYERHSRAILNPHNPIDCERLREGARMAKYALSIYTWMLYVYVHPITGIPRLVCRSCQLCRRRHCRGHHSRLGVTTGDSDSNASRSSLLGDGAIIGDNLCGWHKESLLLVAGIPQADLIYAQFFNRFSLVPYCILLDHESQSVVVSVRGSLSLDDLVTDVHLDPECVYGLAQEHGFEADEHQYCHAGVLASARNVYENLERNGMLEQLLCHEHPEYHLRFVGHSLGAAVCTLLGYMFKAKFPTLQVYNFAPPGCAMTWGLATNCEAWATSFVLDSDIVPRLSVVALERLRDEVLDLIGRLKVPKYQVVENFWNLRSHRACFQGTTGENAEKDLDDLNILLDHWLFPETAFVPAATDEENPNHPLAGGHHQTTYSQQLQEFRRIQQERKHSRGTSRSIQLYPPGRMIHLIKTGEEGGIGHIARKVATCCTTNSGFQYTPVYIANDDLDEILVSPTMATDHFIDRLTDKLEELSQSYALTSMMADTNFGDSMDRGPELV